MRDIIQGSMNDAKFLIQDVMEGVRALTDEQVVTRYVQEHRGNVAGLMDFAEKNAPPDGDVMTEAERYESAMEKILSNMRGGV